MSEPVTLQEAKDHARVTNDAEDDLVEVLITAARERLEQKTGRAIIGKTLILSRDFFPSPGRAPRFSRDYSFIELPQPAIRSVTSVAYTDSDGAPQTLAENTGYTVDTAGAAIHLPHGVSWPDTQHIANAVRITYAAGYASASDVPKLLRVGILWTVAYWYEQRMHVNIGNIVNELPTHLPHIERLKRHYLIHPAEIRTCVVSGSVGTDAGPSLKSFPDIIGLTGGGSTKLDGLDTVSTYGAGTVAILTYGDAAQWWKLRTKALGEVEDGASFVVPDDSSTLIWVKIDGF
jgi:uncharacterized phiE125 gp8 family phage protein